MIKLSKKIKKYEKGRFKDYDKRLEVAKRLLLFGEKLYKFAEKYNMGVGMVYKIKEEF